MAPAREGLFWERAGCASSSDAASASPPREASIPAATTHGRSARPVSARILIKSRRPTRRESRSHRHSPVNAQFRPEASSQRGHRFVSLEPLALGLASVHAEEQLVPHRRALSLDPRHAAELPPSEASVSASQARRVEIGHDGLRRLVQGRQSDRRVRHRRRPPRSRRMPPPKGSSRRRKFRRVQLPRCRP